MDGGGGYLLTYLPTYLPTERGDAHGYSADPDFPEFESDGSGLLTYGYSRMYVCMYACMHVCMYVFGIRTTCPSQKEGSPPLESAGHSKSGLFFFFCAPYLLMHPLAEDRSPGVGVEVAVGVELERARCRSVGLHSCVRACEYTLVAGD